MCVTQGEIQNHWRSSKGRDIYLPMTVEQEWWLRLGMVLCFGGVWRALKHRLQRRTVKKSDTLMFSSRKANDDHH